MPRLLALLLLCGARGLRGCDVNYVFPLDAAAPDPPVSTAMRHTLAWAQVDPGDATGVFMATGAATGCNPGYFGAQFHPNGSQHLIFSMWDAKNTSDRVPASGFPAQSVPASPECRRNKLDGQGTGVQCSPSHAHDPRVQLRFGVPFLFTLEMAAHNSSGATWEAAVRDTSTGVRSTLGRIFFADAALGLDPRQCRTLVSNFSFTRTYSFIEYYGSMSKFAAATWSDLQLLTADGGSIRPSGTTRDCCHHDALHNETSTVCAQPECDALEVRFAGGPFVAVSAKARRENPGCFKHKTDDTARICEHSASQNLTAVRGPCPSGSSAVRLAGANIFDSLWVSSTGMNTCCNPAGQPATFADAKQALHDASKSGIRVFRFFASLFGASGKMSITNETQYWAEFDELMDAIESNGLYCIPSIGTGKMWSQQANAVTAGLTEWMNDVVKNTSSVSWKLQAKYFQKIVARYADRNAVLFWELGNELNLGVNLGPEWCGGEKCFDTDDMVGYTTRLVDIIKASDPRRPISSGFSAGRQAEWHMEHCPSAGKCTVPGGQGGFWGLDSQEQWMSMFVRQNSAVDIMSLHHYMDPKVCYFDATNCGMSTVGLLTLAAEKAASIGKVIYAGEFGGPNPTFTGPSVEDQAFPAAVLDAQVAGGDAFMLSTIWAFESPSHRKDMVEIWPGSTRTKELGSGRMLQLIAAANEKMAAGCADRYSTQEACDADAGCAWCLSGAVPPACNTLADARDLPPSVFECDKVLRN